MKHLPLLFFSSLFLTSLAFPAASKSSEQLELLIDQVYPEITTYLTRAQIKTLFQHLQETVRKVKTIEDIAKFMAQPIVQTLTADQKSETWESIQKAEKKFGGFQQLKVIFYHSIDAVQNFMGDAMDKDRDEIQAKSNGKSNDEIVAMIYEVFRQYFNIEFGQKVVDTVKYSMTEEDWQITIEDAAKYANVQNFNLVY